MRYEDASQGTSNDVSARDDTEHLAGNDFGPATGNIITGAGTVSGSAGADMAAGAHITAIAGAGGSDTSFDASGNLEIAGQYGTLTIDAQGDYTYVRNAGSPEGVSDSFTYTLADAAGATADAKLVIAIGNPPILQAQGGQTIQTANGVVVLPAGVELSDVHVQGRNLVITLPDGSTMVIPDGAIFVPQLVVDGVEVPASNLAALLIGSEPKPAAGDSGPNQLSSGGNFEVPVAPLDPGVPLGDLIPPTELTYTPPEVRDLFPDENNEAPVVGLSSISVSDEGVSSVNAPIPDNTGSPDTTNLRIDSGVIPVSDADGDALTVTLSVPTEALTSQGTAIVWSVSPDGQTVTGTAGANVVITVHIDSIQADGAHYTVTQSRPIDHPVHGSEDAVSFIVAVTASDGEDIGTGAITVSVEDDSPTITGQLREPSLTVDDTTFGVNASASFAGAFDASFGADGPAAANSFAWSLGINAGATGLFDTLSGQEVVLTLVGGVVIGTAGAGGPEVFRVSVDGSGNVTLDQSRAVVHNDPADPVESGESAATLANDHLITLNLVITDRDGDPASLSVDIAQNLHFEDDGPSISVASASEPQLTVDDTTLGTNASASFAANFTPVFGNDGEGTPPVAYTLGVSSSGAASGLFDVASGHQVFLFVESGVVVGREGTDAADAATGDVVFTVSVDGAGVVTLDQSRAVTHNDPSDPVESGGSAAGLSSDGLVTLTATVEDGDGDTATATVGIGSNLHFEDDGPSIAATGTQPVLTVDETILADNASASFAGIFTPTFGNDGQGAPPVAYSLGISSSGALSGLTDSLSGHSVYLFLEGGQVVGREGTSPADAVGGDIVFTVSIDSDGVVTLDQSRAVIHDDPSDPDEASSPATLGADDLVTIIATVEDGDGDTATATANIGTNLHFEDDGPSVSITTAVEPILTVDETNLPDNIGPVSFIDSFSIDFGEDGPASSNSKTFTLTATAGPSGLIDTATGNQVFLFVESGVVVGREGTDAADAATGDVVFTVSVDSTTGDVSLHQERAVQHGDPTDPDEADTPAQLSSDDLIKLNVVAEDADGDTATASVSIGRNLAFEDDGPSIIASGSEPQLTVDDTTLGTNASASFAGTFIKDFGNDGQGTPPVAYVLGVSSSGALSGLIDTASGHAVYLFLEGGQVVGREGTSPADAVGGDIVFTVSIDSAGVVTLDQQRAVVHDNPADPVESGGSAAGLSSDGLITVTATIEDGDGDTATATVGIGSNLHFEDDGPSITATGTQPTLTVDETILANNASASFAGAFAPTFGNDGQGTPPVAYALGVSAPGGVLSGLTETSSGHAVYLFLEAGQVVGREGTSPADAATGDIVFTVSVDSAGLVTLDQRSAVVHDDPLDMDENTSPAMLSADNLITLTATVKDGDNDTATATINIGQNLAFEDDGLTANNDTDSVVGGPGPATGNVITGVEGIFGPDANNTDGVADSFGTDGQGQITRISSNFNGNFDDVASGGNYVVVGHYGTLTINVDGSYSYTRTDLNAAGVSDVFTYTVTDGDGDRTTATLTIGIADNFPTLPDPALVQLDDDALAGGNVGGTNDDADSAGLPGQLVGSGGDGDLDYFFTGSNTLPLTGNFTVNPVNAGTVQILQGATVVLTITLNNEDGSFNVVQNNPITHLAGDTENNYEFQIGVQVQDADGDVEPATITINVDDDTPTVSASSTQPDLTTDDTTLNTNASASFAGVFTTSFGADGQAAVNPTVYALGVSAPGGVLSGLTDTASGHAVYLFLEAGVVVGREGTSPADAVGGDIVFTVSVNSTTGLVTLDQQRAVVHDNPADPIESGGSAAGLSSDGLVTLTKTITDGDGDSASAVANIGSNLHFEDDGPSIVASGTEPQLTVDDSTFGTNASASFAANFIPTYGNDGQGTPNVAYALAVSAPGGVLSGLTDTLSGHAVYLFLEGGQVVGREGTSPADAVGGDIVFTVSVNSSGLVTLDQSRAVVHNDPADPVESGASAAGLSADNLISLTATVKDGDGDTATATINIGSNLHFEDDGPTLGAVQSQQASNDPTQTPAVGTLHFTPGNDGAGSTMTITANVTGLKSGGFGLVTEQVGNVLTAYQDVDGDHIKDAGETTPVFTVTVNPTAGTSGQYIFNLINPLDPTVTEIDVGGTTSFGAGPQPYQVVSQTDVTVDPLAVITGWHTDGATFDVANWYNGTNILPAGVTIASVNGSTAGWGVDNNNFTAGEFFRWDFGEPIDDFDGVGGYAPPNPAVDLPQISTATFQLIGYTAADHFMWVVHFTDGTTANFSNTGNATKDFQFQYVAPAGKFIDWVDTYSPDAGSGKIDLVKVGTTGSTLDVTIPMTVQLTDGDGDTTTTGNFSVHVATGLVPLLPAAPVVLDLNGDGVQFIDHSAGVVYDYGHGAVATAWAAAGDGILVRDANHDGNVTASEFVFGGNGVTDMEALHAQYGDQLDASDADFTQFAVWNDANSNGVVDANELHSLAEAGITSIGLVSDGNAYSAADGDVQVVGTAQFTRADGSTGDAADAIFSTGAVKSTQELERIAANSNNVALAAAVAAAGVVSSTAAAAQGFGDGHFSAFAHAVASQDSLGDTGIQAAYETRAFEFGNAWDSGFHASVQALSGSSHTAIASTQIGELTTQLSLGGGMTNLLDATDFGAMLQMPAPVMAMQVGMPSAFSLQAATSAVTGSQTAGAVEQIIADALHGGGSGPDINALLNALPNHGLGGEAGFNAMATPITDLGSNWDTGHAGVFTMDIANLMTNAPMVLHHDAVQPVTNG